MENTGKKIEVTTSFFSVPIFSPWHQPFHITCITTMCHYWQAEAHMCLGPVAVTEVPGVQLHRSGFLLLMPSCPCMCQATLRRPGPVRADVCGPFALPTHPTGLCKALLPSSLPLGAQPVSAAAGQKVHSCQKLKPDFHSHRCDLTTQK